MQSNENRARQKTGFFTPARVALTVGVISLLVAFGASSCNSTDDSGKSNAPAPRISANPGRSAPAAITTLPPAVRDAELKAVSGAPIRLSDYSGKVLIVNLWATWCGPCRLEIPELVKFDKEYRSKGLEVIGLSTENPEASAAGVRRFVQEFNMDYRVGWATPEIAITLMQGRDAIPQSFVIGRDGRVLKRFVGFNGTATPVQLRQAIEEALKS
ncbi:MAG: TlpA disulfide reductase family protein [Pyrinomonadaceae bacterium]